MHFSVNPGWVNQGIGNLYTHQFAIPLPKAIHRNSYGSRADPELGCHPGVFTFFGFPREKWIEQLKLARPTRLLRFDKQSTQRLLEHRQCPASLENLLRGFVNG